MRRNHASHNRPGTPEECLFTNLVEEEFSEVRNAKQREVICRWLRALCLAEEEENAASSELP